MRQKETDGAETEVSRPKRRRKDRERDGETDMKKPSDAEREKNCTV